MIWIPRWSVSQSQIMISKWIHAIEWVIYWITYNHSIFRILKGKWNEPRPPSICPNGINSLFFYCAGGHFYSHSLHMGFETKTVKIEYLPIWPLRWWFQRQQFYLCKLIFPDFFLQMAYLKNQGNLWLYYASLEHDYFKNESGRHFFFRSLNFPALLRALHSGPIQ